MKLPLDYRPALAVRQGILGRRAEPAVAIVVHTTGSGPAARLRHPDYAGWRARNPRAAVSTFEAASWIYEHAMRFSPHFLVGQEGQVRQLVPAGLRSGEQELIAEHVGASRAGVYARILRHQPEDEDATIGRDHRWWKEACPGLRSPVELAGGLLYRGRTVNANVFGVEVACPLEVPTGQWSERAYGALDELVDLLCETKGIPKDALHVITHSMADPLGRTAKGRPWDPSPEAWAPFRARLRA